MGIEYVYDLCSIEFVEQIWWDINGWGVDVVFNLVIGVV